MRSNSAQGTTITEVNVNSFHEKAGNSQDDFGFT
jgi:hypothetical protein